MFLHGGYLMEKQQTCILTATCRTSSGIVAAATQFLAQQNCYISETAQFDDSDSQRFFMRVRFDIGIDDASIESLRLGFEKVACQYSMNWNINTIDKKVRTIILVSRFDHCLEDIFYRLGKGDLNMEVVAVVSNHLDLQARVEAAGLPYVHLSVTAENKDQQEKKLLELFTREKAELIVLARYM
jgi:formyltetrahydrofolate deformylase